MNVHLPNSYCTYDKLWWSPSALEYVFILICMQYTLWVYIVQCTLFALKESKSTKGFDFKFKFRSFFHIFYDINNNRRKEFQNTEYLHRWNDFNYNGFQRILLYIRWICLLFALMMSTPRLMTQTLSIIIKQ